MLGLGLAAVALAFGCTASPTASGPLNASPVPVTGSPTTRDLAVITSVDGMDSSGPPTTQTPWVQDRLRAVETIYNISAEGRRMLAGLDVRQMTGQPGWFGSYGHNAWTGLGEAKPVQVIHELSHSYWGGFPVSGRSDLAWDLARVQAGGPAMDQYHADVLAFLAQPPDAYEPLRERLRLLPALSSTNTDPLFHTIEADLAYAVGGDLALVPPVLRKYWDRFLQTGPFGTWAGALSWYKGLSPQDREVANGYLGFEHFDLRASKLPATAGATVSTEVSGALASEERQRLSDFVAQFDAMLGDPKQAEDFNFWRGYLRDMLRLSGKHAGYVAGRPDTPARDIDRALAFLESLQGLSAGDAARSLGERLKGDPFVANFLPAVNDGALLALFAGGYSLPDAATLKGTTAFVESLQKVAPIVQDVLAKGRADPAAGAARLTAALDQLALKDRQTLDQFLGLMTDFDYETSVRVASALDDALLRRLLSATPVFARVLASPERLAKALDITAAASPEAVTSGLAALVANTAGNHLIDEPFLDYAYGVLEARAAQDARGTLLVVRDSGLPVRRFIETRPQAAVRVLSSDTALAASLVKATDPVIYTPAHFIHDVAYADPALAARLLTELASRNDLPPVTESLAHLAYDAQRLATDPGLRLSLEKDGAFLAALLQAGGNDWLTAYLREAVTYWRSGMAAGEADPDAIEQFRRTLDAGAASIGNQAAAQALRQAIQSAFGG